MKRSRFLALLLSALLMASFAFAESEDPVVIKAGDITVPLSEAQAFFDELYNQYNDTYVNYYGQTLTAQDIGYIRDEAVDTLEMYALMDNKIAEYGLNEITDEQKEEYRVLSDANFELGVNELMSYYSITREETMELLEANGVTQESQFEMYLENVPYMRLYEYVTSDIEVDDAAVEAEYAQYVESDKASYENDAATYEMYTNYYGSKIYYIPAGFRMIKHILLETPAQIAADMIDYETDMSAVEAELTTLNDELYALENEPEEGEETEDATEPRSAAEIEADIAEKQTELDALTEEYEAVRAKILPELQAQIDEINEKLAGGASFDDLIAEYGTDPGMTSSPDGYKVHADSVIWETNFRDAAMALEKIGDVSEPVVSDFGVHIIQYADDAPSGAVPITDEIYETLRSTLLTTAQDEAFSRLLEEWKAEYGVEKHPELIVLPEASEPATEEAPAEEATEATGDAVQDEVVKDEAEVLDATEALEPVG